MTYRKLRAVFSLVMLALAGCSSSVGVGSAPPRDLAVVAPPDAAPVTATTTRTPSP